MDPAYWKHLIRPVFTGRRWLLVRDLLVAATSDAELLHFYAAEKSFAIAGSEGTGNPPDPELVDWVVLGTGGDTIMQGFRNFRAALDDLPAAVVERIDAWDPDGSALAVGGFVRSDMLVAGRREFGGRWPEWEALEDKITIDSLWDAAGVVRAPSEIVAAERSALLAASARLDGGVGTVWAGDNKEGWHGGAEYVRWVPDTGDSSEPVDYMERHCDQVRVMPFLDGIPCSIHGIVFPDQVVTFRPGEIIVLRSPGKATFRYGGVATYWEAPADDVEYMRSAARAVGAHLRGVVGYRGAFGMDGVLTADGWRPTELNARTSVGLGTLVSAVDDLSLGTLNRVIVEGVDLDYRPSELEAVVREATDGKGRGGGHMMVSRQQKETVSHDIVFAAGSAARLAGDDETPDATLEFGPGPQGGFVRLDLDPGRAEFGTPAAPRAAAAFMLADELWDLGVGELEPAPELR